MGSFTFLLVSASAETPPLDVSLKSWVDLPQPELIQKLEDFRNAAFQAEKQKERAAYVLARTMQKALSPGTDTDTTKKVIDLYTEASKVDGLWERSQNHIVEVATVAKLEPELRTHLEQIRSKVKDPAAKNAAIFALAQSYYRTQEFETAVPLFLKIQKDAATSNQAISSNYYLAKMDIAAAQTATPGAGLSDTAVAYFRNYLAAAPNGRFAREIADTLLNAAGAASGSGGAAQAPLPATDREMFGEVYYDTGNWSGALEQWQLANSPHHLLQKSLCLAHLGRNKEAQAMLLQAVARHETSARTTYDAVATILTNPLTRQQTADFYKQVLAAHPAKADAALWNVAIRSPLPEAQPLFQKIVSTYPTSEFAPESLWWLVWAQAKIQHQTPAKLAAAVSLAHVGMTKYPNTKATAKLAFWAGKMDELLRQPEQAKQDYEYAAKNFPSYYYGLRAATRLSLLNSAKKAADRGWSTKPDRQLKPDWQWPDYEQMTPADSMTKRYGKTVAQLVSLQQLDEAVDELPPDTDADFKGALRAAAGDYAGAIRAAGKNLDGRPADDDRWQMSYPRMYAAYVMTGAQTNNLDPLLIHALIREESRYNAMAISRSKAIGLTQLMPGTAAGVAKRLGVPLSGTADVYKPEINIKLGTNYLSSVLQRAQNNALLAVASYNGGPNAVQSWLKEHNAAGYPDFDYFVENIPFRETRDYVRKVFGSYWTYERVYADR